MERSVRQAEGSSFSNLLANEGGRPQWGTSGQKKRPQKEISVQELWGSRRVKTRIFTPGEEMRYQRNLEGASVCGKYKERLENLQEYGVMTLKGIRERRRKDGSYGLGGEGGGGGRKNWGGKEKGVRSRGQGTIVKKRQGRQGKKNRNGGNGMGRKEKNLLHGKETHC